MGSTLECKLSNLLDEFLLPDCKIKDDIYFNTLLSHIQSIQTKHAGMLVNWILKAVAQWEQSGTPSNVLVVSFFMNVLCCLTRNESYFNDLQIKQVYDKIMKWINIRDTRTPCTLKLSFVRLFKTFLMHERGTAWIIETNIWEYVLILNSENMTIYLSRDTQQAISELIKKTVKLNEGFCRSVIKKIIKPLEEKSAILKPCIGNTIEIHEERLFESLKVSLSLINFVFEDILSSICIDVLKIFINKNSLTEHVSSFYEIAHDSEFLYSLGKILIALEMCKLLTDPEHVESDNIHQTLHSVLKIVSTANNSNVLKLSQTVFVYSRMIKKCKGKYVESISSLDNQFLSVQLLPIIMMSKSCTDQVFLNADYYQQDITTIFQIKCNDCSKFLVHWQISLRDNLADFPFANKSLSYLMSSKKFFSRVDAINLSNFFTIVIRNLKNDTGRMKDIDKTFTYRISLPIAIFFTNILDALCILHTEHDIFVDCLESVSLVAVLKDILQLEHIRSQVKIQVMKLLNITMKKFTTTNIDSLQEHLNDLGALLYSKFGEDSWEERDSAIELLTTLSTYPTFHSVAVKNNLTTSVLRMALYDPESFVRVTALQSLNSMIKIDQFWEHLNQKQNIIRYLLIKFQNDTEGTVRKELIAVLCTIYSFGRLENNELLYDVILVASNDLHWEVKIEAIKFWNLVIKYCIEKQGLKDVCSEENLNPENLTKPEICNRLDVVLNELSQVGCLGAVVGALRDDCDIDVLKQAVTITQPFIELVRSTKLSDSIRTEGDLAALNVENGSSYLNTDEIASGTNNFINEHMNKNKQNSEGKKQISPSEFIQFIQQDFKGILNERKRWLMGIDELESLLDDMLKKYDNFDADSDDVNRMDCY